MTPKRYLLGIDQGSSGSRALVIDFEGQPLGYGYRALPRIYPRPDQVEQDPQTVAATVAEAIADALAETGCRPSEVAAIGIACQRNTDFAWHTDTRQPFGNAISWQDTRTLPLMETIDAWTGRTEYRRRLGFYPGPYSSALHLAWRIRNDPDFALAARSGKVRVGFSAEWLLNHLGHSSGHFMDESLVQATGLYDFRRGCYWEDWLAFLGIPEPILPQPKPTISDFGALAVASRSGPSELIPVLAMIGDQQAALFGHNCHRPGDAECTHGTASFVNIFIDENMPEQQNLKVYHYWHLPDQNHTY